MTNSKVDMQLTQRPPAVWGELVAACDELLEGGQGRTRHIAETAFNLVNTTCDQQLGESVRYYAFGKLTCHYSPLIEKPQYRDRVITTAAKALAASAKKELKVVNIDAWVMSTGFTEVTQKAADNLTAGELLLADVVHGVSHNRAAKAAAPGSKLSDSLSYDIAMLGITRGGVTQKIFREAVMGGASKLFKEALMLKDNDISRPITESDEELRLLGERLKGPASSWTAVRVDELNAARGILCEKDGVLQAQNLPQELKPVVDPMSSFHESRLICPAQFVRNKNLVDSLPTGAVHQAVRLLPEIIITTRELL